MKYRAMIRVAAAVAGLVLATATQAETGFEDRFNEREVSFEAEDGWVIHGTLSIPVGVGRKDRVPGAVLVHSPSHDRDIYLGRHQIGMGEYAQENLRTALGMAITLRIDIRGRGQSADPQEYHAFTAEQRGRVALDVAAAIEFLSGQKRVHSDRIGVVVEGASADAAVLGAFSDSRVRGVVLLSGRLGPEAKQRIEGSPELPVLALVTKEDKQGFVDMTDAFKLSGHPESDVWVFENLGTGNSMFIMWAATRRDQPQLEHRVAAWLLPKLNESLDKVSFRTSDGWTIHADLRLPARREPGGSPGVVLVHSYLTDRHVFNRVSRMLAADGLATLAIDFRGRGKSIDKGTYFYLSLEERAKSYLDVLAGLEFLAAQDGVDGNRLAVVGSSIGAKYGLQAANHDARVKAVVALGGMPDREDVVRAGFPILFVSSLGIPPIAEAFRDFYRLASHEGSHLLEYPGGSIGYQIFAIDESLEPAVVSWLKPRLLYRMAVDKSDATSLK